MALHREIYILSGLNHPNIMKLYEVIDSLSYISGTVDMAVYTITMPLVDPNNVLVFANGKLLTKDSYTITQGVINSITLAKPSSFPSPSLHISPEDLKLTFALLNSKIAGCTRTIGVFSSSSTAEGR